MKEYVLLFRSSSEPAGKLTQEQINQMMSSWKKWMDDIANSGKLANNGTRLGIADSKIVRGNNVVTNGPYIEVKEFINGFMIIKVESLDEAVSIAKECPMVKGGGGAVEVRPAVAPDNSN